MSIGENYQLVMISTLAIASAMLTAIVRADPNPYLQGDSRNIEANRLTTKKSTSVNLPQKIQSVNGKKLRQNTKDPWFGEGPVFRESSPFVKSSGERKMQSLPKAKSAPKSIASAIDIDRQIREKQDTYKD